MGKRITVHTKGRKQVEGRIVEEKKDLVLEGELGEGMSVGDLRHALQVDGIVEVEEAVLEGTSEDDRRGRRSHTTGGKSK